MGEENFILVWFRVFRFNFFIWCVNYCFKILLIIIFVCFLFRKIIKYLSIFNLVKKRKKNYKLYNFCNIFLISKYMYKYNIKFMKLI